MDTNHTSRLTDRIIPHILCGGAGTRLWPISREAFPKQFVPLINGKSLLTCTLERASLFGSSPVCINQVDHRFLVNMAAEGIGSEIHQILEPVARNTAPAMACAAILSQPDDILLFLPADHYIQDNDLFVQTITGGLTAAKDGYIVVYGVVPSFPSTGYGYIQRGGLLESGVDGEKVLQFTEKPDQLRAESMLLSGQYLWNAGIFLVKSKFLVSALEKHAPDILQHCRLACAKSETWFGHRLLNREALLPCRSESIDYALLEHHDRIAVLPFAGAWSDVGSWNAVAELAPADKVGNRLVGQVYAENCQNIYVNEDDPRRTVVLLGIKDTVIIDTPDALLVCARDKVEDVKGIVSKMKEQGSLTATQHRKVARPWGEYDSIDMGERHQVKRIRVKPGSELSLQMHHHRAEHWIVVRGTAKIIRGDEEIILTENQSTYIPLGAKHRLINPGKIDLEIIEVQSGSYLGEDDIVRFADQYGRSSPPSPAITYSQTQEPLASNKGGLKVSQEAPLRPSNPSKGR